MVGDVYTTHLQKAERTDTQYETLKYNFLYVVRISALQLEGSFVSLLLVMNSIRIRITFHCAFPAALSIGRQNASSSFEA